MFKPIFRYRKLKKQLQAITRENWDGRLFAGEWDDWPLMREAMRAMESKIDLHSMEALKNKQAEYLALQNQINPHFLYNTLEAIRGDALYEGARGIAETTKALATFFRYTITEVGYEVTLEDELGNVENYFTIQRYRFDEKLQMVVDMPVEAAELLRARIPKLTLQPLVENAISHGLENKIGNGTVTVQIEASRNNLYISVRDDGIGIKEDRLRELNRRLDNSADEGKERFCKGSIALINVNSRIRLLYGSGYGLQIYSIPDMGTEVKVTLPLLRV